MADTLEAIQESLLESLHVYLVIIIVMIITIYAILIPYKIYKKKTGKTIDWLEHGILEEDKDEEEIVKIINDKITYLGIKNEKSTKYKTSIGTVTSSSDLSSALLLSPVKESVEVIYFKYGEDVVYISDNPELYFLVKEKKYEDTLNCKVKQVSKLGKIISKTIESIEGVKV